MQTQEERAAWLEGRRKSIGASDIAKLVVVDGKPLSPWGGPLDLYLDKLGLLPDAPSEAKRWGLRLESVVAEAFAEETGRACYPDQSTRTAAGEPWMSATPDWRVDDGFGPLEVKTSRTAEGWGPSGTDLVPFHYLCQLQWQLAVLGCDRGFVAVLIGGSDFRWYEVPRNEEIIFRLTSIGRDFWEVNVQPRRPPEPDWSHPDTPRLVELLHRPSPGETMDLGEGAVALVASYERARGQEKAAKAEAETARALLCEYMRAASVGRLPDGREVRRKLITIPERVQPVRGHERIDFRICKGRDS